ncbi:MAG: DAK2 domain-containing protein [Anaerolineaceae bacterium]
MANQSIDLLQVFQSVAKVMGKNKASLNEADVYNHDHGTNMAQTFKVITQAMEEKQNASPADQLAYASELLRQKQQSGSAKLYADGLARAATTFQGQDITADNATLLIQSLMGGGRRSKASLKHQLIRWADYWALS